jgi:hypothetical protein
MGQDAAEALKPAAQGFLSWRSPPSERAPGTLLMDIRRDCFQQLIPAMVVDVVEALCRLRYSSGSRLPSSVGIYSATVGGYAWPAGGSPDL